MGSKSKTRQWDPIRLRNSRQQMKSDFWQSGSKYLQASYVTKDYCSEYIRNPSIKKAANPAKKWAKDVNREILGSRTSGQPAHEKRSVTVRCRCQ